jgi:hypothetical protein
VATDIQVTGVFQTATDRDYFQFTAAASGQVELTLTAPAAVGAAWLSPEGQMVTTPTQKWTVVAGQTYVVGVASAAGTIGRYDLNIALRPDTAPPPPRDLGTITQLWQPEVALTGGQAAFQFVASRTGRLTVELLPATTSPATATLRLYDAHGPVASTQGKLPAGQGTSTQGALRLDLDVVAGQSYRVVMESAAPRVGLRLTNLVTFQAGQVEATGTAAADQFVYQGGVGGWLEINNVRYDLSGMTQVSVEASASGDRLLLRGGSPSETFVLTPGTATCRSVTQQFVARGLSEVQVLAQADDEVQLFDSPASDLVLAGPRGVSLITPQSKLTAEGAGRYDVVAQAGGNDTARLIDSPGDDQLLAGPRQATLVAGGVTLRVRGFAQTVVTATAGGYDRAMLDGFGGRDRLLTMARSVALVGTGYGVRLSGIEWIQTASGQDLLRLASLAASPSAAPPSATLPDDHLLVVRQSDLFLSQSAPVVMGGCADDVPSPASHTQLDDEPILPGRPLTTAEQLQELGELPRQTRLRRLQRWLVQLHTDQPPKINLEAVDSVFVATAGRSTLPCGRELDLAAVDYVFQKLGSRPA